MNVWWAGGQLRVEEGTWKVLVKYSFAYNAPDVYFRRVQTGVSVQELEQFNVNMRVFIEEVAGEVMYRIHACGEEVQCLKRHLSAIFSEIGLQLPFEFYLK